MNQYQNFRGPRPPYDQRPHFRRPRGGGDKRWFGFAIVIVGIIILLKKLEVIPYFNFHNNWPYYVIAIGLIIGIKNKFRHNAWWILILIGAASLLRHTELYNGIYLSHIMLPAILIIIGLLLILRPPSKKKGISQCSPPTITSENDLLFVNVTFGGRKEIVTSKNFKGGDVNTTFGGTEINLMQADTPDDTISLNVKVSFGEVEIIIPSHWEVKNDIAPTFGNVEDHRTFHNTSTNNEDKKILKLTGSCSFGSIEIKSY